MSMQIMDVITQKIQRLAQETLELRKENRALQSEIELLREQEKKHRPASIENEKHQKERERIKTRLDRIGAKLLKLNDMITPQQAVLAGDPDEKYHE